MLLLLKARRPRIQFYTPEARGLGGFAKLHGYIAKWLIVKLLRAKDRGWTLHAVRPKASAD